MFMARGVMTISHLKCPIIKTSPARLFISSVLFQKTFHKENKKGCYDI